MAARLSRPGPWGDVPDPRLVFLGGEEVYRVELACWIHYTGRPSEEVHRLILERFGDIRSPLTVELALDMWKRSSCPDEALSWLDAHGTYAAPVLEQLATSNARLARTATDALAEIGA